MPWNPEVWLHSCVAPPSDTLTLVLFWKVILAKSLISLFPDTQCMPSWFSHGWLFGTLWTIACQAPLSMGFSRQNNEVDCHFLLQGFFLTQGSNLQILCLLHYRQMFYPLNQQGSPLYWWGECKLMQSLWKFLKKLKIEILAIPLLGIREKQSERIHAPQCSYQHCLQLPRHGYNLNVH